MQKHETKSDTSGPVANWQEELWSMLLPVSRRDMQSYRLGGQLHQAALRRGNISHSKVEFCKGNIKFANLQKHCEKQNHNVELWCNAILEFINPSSQHLPVMFILASDLSFSEKNVRNHSIHTTIWFHSKYILWYISLAKLRMQSVLIL